MSEADFYILVNGEETGPFSLQQLREMLANQEVTWETLYAQPGMSEWLPLGSLGDKIIVSAPSSGDNAQSKSASIELSLPGNEALWAQAAADVLHERGIEVVVKLDGQIVVPQHTTAKSERSVEVQQLSEDVIALRQAGIGIEDGWLTIKEPHFFGQCSRSPNGRFILAWREAFSGDVSRGESGQYLLFDGPTIILPGTLQRPQDGKVANNGTFIVNDTGYPSDATEGLCPSGTFRAFSPSGEVIINQQFESGLDTNGISDDGRYAVCCGTTVPNPDESEDTDLDLEEDSDDCESDKLCLFDLEQRKMLARFALVFGSGSGIDSGRWQDREYAIDSTAMIVRVVYKSGVVHRYGFDGTFLDAEEWESEQLEFASGYELLNVAQARLLTRQGAGLASYSEVIGLLERALAKGVSDLTQAKIHRQLGEIYDLHSEKAKALQHLETALRLCPGIGVKKQVARLKADCQDGH